MAAPHLPPWIRNRLPALSELASIQGATYAKGLATVCREARCPNQGQCAENRTATFLILGDCCTRTCTFCAVRHGQPLPLCEDEPERVAESVAALGLRHAVITSVTRDDLLDGGAQVFASTIEAIRQVSPGTTVEVLIPDFRGERDALATVAAARPEVFNHNVETVPRLYRSVRPHAEYRRSLAVLRFAREHPSMIVKSGIMVGVGESDDELRELFTDLANSGCQVLTIGQYLRPTSQHHPVHRYVAPEEFDRLKEEALAAGLEKVVAGPLVRSSYRAATVYREVAGKRRFSGNKASEA